MAPSKGKAVPCFVTTKYWTTKIIYFAVLIGFILLYVYRRKAVIKLAQIPFLIVVLVGCVVDTTSIIFMSQDNRHYSQEQLDRSCFAWPWLVCLGHMMTTATLIAKIYRVKRVCMSNGTVDGFRKVKVSVKEGALFIIGFMAVDVMILSTWYAIAPFEWKVTASGHDPAGFISEVSGKCRPAGNTEVFWIFPSLLLVWHGVVLLYANALVYETRNLHKISDSKHVAIAVFNSLQLLILTISLTFGGNSEAASYMVRVFFIFLNNICVLFLVVLRKIYACMSGRGGDLPDIRDIRAKSGRSRHFRSVLRSALHSSLDENPHPPETARRSSPTHTSTENPDDREERKRGSALVDESGRSGAGTEPCHFHNTSTPFACRSTSDQQHA